MKSTRRSHPSPPPNDPWSSPRLVLGIQPVREAIRAHGGNVTSVRFDGRGGPALAALARFAESKGVADVVSVERQELDRLARGTRHQGAAAWAPPLRARSLDELLEGTAPLAVALDGITDPQNFGAVVRSAVGLAQAGVLWQRSHSAPLTPATFRASAGAIEHARLCQVPSLRGALADAATRGIRIVGLAADGAVDVSQVDLAGPTLIVVGAEGEGMSRGVRRTCSTLARISAQRMIDSLNASVACSIALYEAQRQRGTVEANATKIH